MSASTVADLLPRVSDLDRPFWEGCRAGELRVQTCRACGRQWFPPATHCPSCLGVDIEWRAVSGTWRVWSSTVLHQKYFAAFADQVPYLVAFIELTEGPCMVSTVIDVAFPIACGTPVQVFFEPVTPEQSVPKFRVVES